MVCVLILILYFLTLIHRNYHRQIYFLSFLKKVYNGIGTDNAYPLVALTTKTYLYVCRTTPEDGVDDLSILGLAEHPHSDALQRSSLLRPLIQPPSGILGLIFERTIPPRCLLDPAGIYSPKSLWDQVFRQKQALVNVCKAWYLATLPSMYEEINIYHNRQLQKSLRTLETPDADFKKFVEFINFSVELPECAREILERLLKRLFELCPNDSSFSCLARSSGLTSLNTLSPRITHLHFDRGFKMTLIANVLEITAQNLISLYLGSFVDLCLVLESIHLPSLEELSCDTKMLLQTWREDHTACYWDIPRIKRLTLRSISFGAVIGIDDLITFFKKYGDKPEFLHVGTFFAGLSSNDTIRVGHLLALCSLLEHIVISSTVPLGPLEHERIKWVDIWVWSNLVDVDDTFYKRLVALRGCITESLFPSLRGVRELSHSLKHLPNILSVFPPAANFCGYNFLALDIRHDIGRIYGNSKRAPKFSQPDHEPLHQSAFCVEDVPTFVLPVRKEEDEPTNCLSRIFGDPLLNALLQIDNC